MKSVEFVLGARCSLQRSIFSEREGRLPMMPQKNTIKVCYPCSAALPYVGTNHSNDKYFVPKTGLGSFKGRGNIRSRAFRSDTGNVRLILLPLPSLRENETLKTDRTLVRAQRSLRYSSTPGFIVKTRTLLNFVPAVPCILR